MVQIVHQRRMDTQLVRAIESNQSDSVAALLKQGTDRECEDGAVTCFYIEGSLARSVLLQV